MEIVNPDFVPFTSAQFSVLDTKMQELIMLLFQYTEPPLLGDGNLEMMTEDLLYRALKALTESGVLLTDDGHAYELKGEQE